MVSLYMQERTTLLIATLFAAPLRAEAGSRLLTQVGMALSSATLLRLANQRVKFSSFSLSSERVFIQSAKFSPFSLSPERFFSCMHTPFCSREQSAYMRKQEKFVALLKRATDNP